MSLNQQQSASSNNSNNSSSHNFKKRASRLGKKSASISFPSGNVNKSTNLIASSTAGDNNLSKIASNLIQSKPCNLTTKHSITNLSNDNVLSNLSTSSFNSDLSIFSSHYDTPQNLSTHQSNAINAINLSTLHYNVGQKNTPFCYQTLMTANLTTSLKPPTATMSTYNHLFNFNEINSVEFDKRILNEELCEILKELKKLTIQLEQKVSGRPNDVNLVIKHELFNLLDRISKCMKQDDDQFDEEEETGSYNSGLMSLNQLKQFNYNSDLNNNPIASLNSPVSINSPSASSLSTNHHQDQKQDEEDKDEVFFCNTLNRALKFNTTNHKDSSNSLMNSSNNNKSNAEDDLDTQQMTFGDQFIIDNRKNMNQNRIKSSILGAVKHLSNKKRQQEQTRQSFSDDNNSAINLTINSSSMASNSTAENQLQEQSKSKCICHVCNQSFTQRNSLNRHIRGHTGEKPYPCVTCGKSFSDKQRLLIHHRIHSGERPFSCSLCKRSFTQKSTVKRHLIVHFGQGGSSNTTTPNPNFNNALNLKKKTKSKKPLKGNRKRKFNQSTALSSTSNELVDDKNEE